MESIIKEYESYHKRYVSYSVMLESLIKSLLLNNEIIAHSINSRVKSKESLEQKIERKGAYLSIDEITDVVGIRIITHYSDEVDLIAKIIESEFNVDAANSIDKRKSLAPDKFGYLSLHYVVSLSKIRCELAENIHYKNFKAEIQIRSILQHTWAEIEHDTGYKSSIEVPYHIRRQFSRLAGLLEIADEQFVNIKKSLIDYKENVSGKVLSDSSEHSIYLDSITYDEYLANSEVIELIKKEIFDETNVVFGENTENLHIAKSEYIRAGLFQLSYFNIDTVKKFDEALRRHYKFIVRRVINIINERFVNKAFNGPIHLVGVYLSQAIAAKNNNRDEVIEFLSQILTKQDEKGRESMADTIIQVHQSVEDRG